MNTQDWVSTPDLRAVLARIALLSPTSMAHRADGAASDQHPLYGATVWYMKQEGKLYAGLRDGAVMFTVDERGFVNWLPLPVNNYEINQIILQAKAMADIFQLMLSPER
jgi:hypothetical protein